MMKYMGLRTAVGISLLLAVSTIAQEVDQRQGASNATVETNNTVYSSLNFSDKTDFDNADKGLIDRPGIVTICKDDAAPSYPLGCQGNACRCTPGTEVWDLEDYKLFIDPTQPISSIDDNPAPPTVNPSLWRNAQLNMKYGLFRVAGSSPITNDPLLAALDDQNGWGIYQVRGYDLSNITFVRGDSGWIVFDPLISPETARAALELINTKLLMPGHTVSVIIYSHSHIDHYGGAPGLFTDPSNISSDVKIIAPENFTEHAVSENVTAGNAMGRRAIYMYGSLLERDAKGGVNAGLGQTSSTGVAGLILPTITVSEENNEPIDLNTGNPLPTAGVYQGRIAYDIDGVHMEFQMTPGTEAPAEMNTFLSEHNALWMAENTTNTMHNILTLRGAQVRDAYKWSAFLNETIETWGSLATVKFQSHHWPLWGNNEIVSYFKKQRDIYKFTHDQTVRMMNNGLTGEEISEIITLPPQLETNWSTRGYYGTLRHNSRAVYQFYMGWYDGHPSDLNNLPPVEVAKKYMDYMDPTQYSPGQTVVQRARDEFDNPDEDTYRWVAEVMKHAVFANPADDNAKDLLADALEQLGYQAESGPWRSVYLVGASELRASSLPSGGTQTATPDTIRAMTPEMVFDFLAVHVCPFQESSPDCSKGAATVAPEGNPLVINVTITDLPPNGQDPLRGQYTLTVENAVLNYTKGLAGQSDVGLSMEMSALYDVLLGENPDITIDSGNSSLYDDFINMLDLEDEFWFNIVTP